MDKSPRGCKNLQEVRSMNKRKNKNIKNKIAIILSWTAVFLWLVVIFSFSAQPATKSDGLSKKVTKVIIETVDKVIPIENGEKSTIDLVQKFDHIVRKYAHFTVYIVLGLLMMNATGRNGLNVLILTPLSFPAKSFTRQGKKVI